MKKQKSKMPGLLLITAALALTACGNAKTDIQILENTGDQPEYLNFFSSESLSGSDITKYWSDHFTEKYNKKVYINFEGASYYADEGLSYREILEKRIESSSPDDMYIINAEDVLEFEKKNYWMDLSDMDFVNNLSDAALYQSTYNGKVFSLPLSFTGFGFIWNVDMLQEHGLIVPSNLEEFLNVCEKLKADGILPYGANKGSALTVPAMCTGLAELYRSMDQEQRIAALNSGETTISTYMREGFTFLSLMIEKGYLDPKQALEAIPGKEDVNMFLEGKCAFICSGLSNTQIMKEKSFQIKMTGVPVLAEECIAVYGANRRLCVNPNSKHLDTVHEFVEMVGAWEALEESAALEHSMSSAKDSKIAEFPTEQELVELLKQPGQIPNQDFALHFNTWENIREVSKEICGGISVEQACSMLDEIQYAELKEYTAN